MAESVAGAVAEGVDMMLLMRARARLSALAVQLEVAPFSEGTTASMRAYLEDDAESAQAAFSRWVALPKQARDELAAQLRTAQT
ncbi:hypothetical protein ACIRFF_36550 [Streptomyces cyaneofuscatus]